MTVESQAGRFMLSFERMEPGEGEIIITGTMGVWEAKTHMTLPEFIGILKMTLKPRMLGFLTRELFTGGFRSRRAS